VHYVRVLRIINGRKSEEVNRGGGGIAQLTSFIICTLHQMLFR
jgi:hypothetical protein